MINDLVIGLIKSVFHYPSLIFWIWVLSPALDVLIYLVFMFFDRPFTFSTVPMQYEAYNFTHLQSAYTFISCFMFFNDIQIFYFIRRAFTKCITHAAPRAKVIFSYYSRLMLAPMIINLVANFLKNFINPKLNPLIYFGNYVLISTSNLAIIYCFNQMDKLREGIIRPIGWYVDIFLYVSYAIIIPCIYMSLIHNCKNWYRILGSYMYIIVAGELIAKYTLIASETLGNRFLRLPENNL